MDRRKRTSRTVALMSLFTMTDIQENVSVASFDGDGSELVSLLIAINSVDGCTETTVTRTGVNIWDGEWEDGSIDGTTGQNEIASGFWRTKGYIPITPNGTYYVACSVYDAPLRSRFYDKNKNFIGISDPEGQGVNTGRTFKAPANAYFVRFAPNASVATTKEISVNYPATNTVYEPYQGETYTITFPAEAGAVYDATLDVTNGKLTVSSNVYDTNPVFIQTLIGTNNIWADTGEIKYIEYNV